MSIVPFNIWKWNRHSLLKFTLWRGLLVHFDLWFQLLILIFKCLYFIIEFRNLSKVTFNGIFLSLLDCPMLFRVIWSIIRMMFEAKALSCSFWTALKPTLNPSFSTHRITICHYCWWRAFYWFIIIWVHISIIYLFRHLGVKVSIKRVFHHLHYLFGSSINQFYDFIKVLLFCFINLKDLIFTLSNLFEFNAKYHM